MRAAHPALALHFNTHNTKSGSSQPPAGRQLCRLTQPGLKEAQLLGGHMPPFGDLWWLLLGWCKGAVPGSFSTGRLHKQKVIPQGHGSPHALSSVRPTEGLTDPPGKPSSAGAKARLIHYFQLRHLSPVAGPWETAVQSCYLRYLVRSALRDFVTRCKWPGIPKLGLLSILCVFSTTPTKFPFPTENSKTAKEMTHKWKCC